MNNDRPPTRPNTPAALIGDLGDVWASLDALLSSLDEDAFAAPTACPGWSVSDVVAHITGTELMMAGEAAPAVEVPDLAHLRNDIGRANEAWIIERRSWNPAQIVDEFRSVVDRRTSELAVLTQDDIDAASWTPAGHATLGRFLQIRVFDTWIHELDIRDAVGEAGHESGPAVRRTLAEIGNGLGFVVGKKAAAPDGSWVRIELPGPEGVAYNVVVDGRASLVDAAPPGEPTVSLTASSTDFVRCIGGRIDSVRYLEDGRITLRGDEELGARVVAELAYTI